MRVENFIYSAGSAIISAGAALGSIQSMIMTKNYAIQFFKIMDFTPAGYLYIHATLGSLFCVVSLAMTAFQFYDYATAYYKDPASKPADLSTHTFENIGDSI